MQKLFCGIDLGGTSIKGAIAPADGEILARDSIPTDSHLGPDVVIKRMSNLVGQLLESIVAQEATDEQPTDMLSGIGIGAPGWVDVATGTTKFLPNLPTQWRDIEVAEKLAARYSCPIRLLNDVRMATLGELRYGHGAESPKLSMAFFSLGTGVGGGIAIDGKIRLGPLGSAGELGHQTVIPDGSLCGCGNRGCLETVASGPAIAAEGIKLMRMGLAPHLYDLVDGESGRVSTKEMALAAEHDTHIAAAIERAGQFIGIAAANVVTIVHPQLIVIGGGVAEIGDRLLQPVRQQIRDRVGMFPTDDILVEGSKLSENAGIMGAIALAQESV